MSSELTPRELAAEAAALGLFDRVRNLAGHDYGRSRRQRELDRRTNALGVELGWLIHAAVWGRDGEGVERWIARAEQECGGPLTADELVAGWDRCVEPRRRRLMAETRRIAEVNGGRLTPAARRTLDSYARAHLLLGAHIRRLGG